MRAGGIISNRVETIVCQSSPEKEGTSVYLLARRIRDFRPAEASPRASKYSTDMNNKKTTKIGAGNMANTKGKEKSSVSSHPWPTDDADIYGYSDETDYGYGEDQGGKEADDSHSKLNYGYGDDGPLAICRRKPEAQQQPQPLQPHSSHKRMQRRLSTGTMSCGSAYSMDSQSFRVEDLLTGAATPVRHSSRRSSLSNSIHSSASSNSYGQSSIDLSCDMDGITSIGDLKELSRSKKNLKTKRRVNRRSSLSSIYTSGSSHASSSVHSIHLEMSGGVTSTTSPRISNHAHSAESSLGAFSNDEMTEASGIDFMDAMLAAHHASHASSLTLPVTNVVETPEPIPQEKKKSNRARKKRNTNNSGNNKKDHIVESLVWFSFHIPRTVLEDLIAHELEVWKTEHCKLLRKASQRSVGGGCASE